NLPVLAPGLVAGVGAEDDPAIGLEGVGVVHPGGGGGLGVEAGVEAAGVLVEELRLVVVLGHAGEPVFAVGGIVFVAEVAPSVGLPQGEAAALVLRSVAGFAPEDGVETELDALVFGGAGVGFVGAGAGVVG